MVFPDARLVRALTIPFDYPRGVGLRIALAAAALSLPLALAAPAAAAEVSLALESSEGVRLGKATEMSGQVTENGAPVAGRVVTLEVRRHPFRSEWRQTGITATTRADGGYAFARRLDRNHQVRVRLVGVPPEADVLSPTVAAYVLPAFTLTFDQRGRRRLRLRQVYTVPRDAHLSAPTRFYVGPCEPDEDRECTVLRARFRVEAETRRVRAGRYRSVATVRLPKSYGGRFQYVSCFVYSAGSGMGDPEQRCPKKYARLD
jgi:hypothetical protein